MPPKHDAITIIQVHQHSNIAMMVAYIMHTRSSSMDGLGDG